MIQLHPGLFVVATTACFRLYRPSLFESGVIGESVDPVGREALTTQALAGAFYAGMTDGAVAPANPSSQDACQSLLLRHIHGLAGSYQTTSVTPPVMRQAAASLMSSGREVVAAHCLQVAQDEAGHDTLALLDLTALGLPAQAFVDRLKPKKSVALVDLFRSMAGSDVPVSTLGYAYALERAALFTKAATIDATEAAMPRGVRATRCMRVHSAVGSDSGHVAESIKFIASLPAHDRIAIARATYAAVRLMYGEPDDYPGDGAMRALLRDFGWPHEAVAS